jgi:hypothetical protein
MPITTKQTPEQINKNVEEVAKRVLPSVLANSVTNATLINGYLMTHHMDNDVIDASADALHAAIVSLHREGKLRWDKPPGKVTYVRPIKEVDPLGMESRHKAILAANQEKENGEATKLINSLRSAARNFTGQTHSISYGGREVLTKALDAELRKTPKPNVVRAQEIEKIMRQKTIEAHQR